MQIIYTSQFERKYKKLSYIVKQAAEKKEKIFRKNPFQASLRTHKLTGNFKEFWAFSITFEFRIIFEFGENDIVYFHSIGTHDIYR